MRVWICAKVPQKPTIIMIMIIMIITIIVTSIRVNESHEILFDHPSTDQFHGLFISPGYLLALCTSNHVSDHLPRISPTAPFQDFFLERFTSFPGEYVRRRRSSIIGVGAPARKQ